MFPPTVFGRMVEAGRSPRLTCGIGPGPIASPHPPVASLLNARVLLSPGLIKTRAPINHASIVEKPAEGILSISCPNLPYSAAIPGGKEAMAGNSLVSVGMDQKTFYIRSFRCPKHTTAQKRKAFSKKRKD
jgi:hypothetical protein